MLENERIIVDRGGIDPGIAALMQNANKGFDPAALMAMMNNGNGMFGGNGGWWWIFIIVLFWMWGGWVATASVVATRLKPTLTSLV